MAKDVIDRSARQFFLAQPGTVCYKTVSSGCSAAWLAHLPWEQGVGGSNPLTPTTLRL